MLFAPAYRLVQDLLAAKRDLALPRQLRRLNNYDFLLLNDLAARLRIDQLAVLVSRDYPAATARAWCG